MRRVRTIPRGTFPRTRGLFALSASCRNHAFDVDVDRVQNSPGTGKSTVWLGFTFARAICRIVCRAAIEPGVRRRAGDAGNRSDCVRNESLELTPGAHTSG